jgi:hypothetical protein
VKLDLSSFLQAIGGQGPPYFFIWTIVCTVLILKMNNQAYKLAFEGIRKFRKKRPIGLG